MSCFKSLILPTWYCYLTSIVNVLQQRNFEEEFEQIMEESNNQLQEYFRYIASN